MSYLELLRKHGVLVAVVVVLGSLLAATNSDMLNQFESLRFGPVEAKLRALSLKGRSAREVDAKQAGAETIRKDTLNLWLPVQESSPQNEFLEKAKVLSRLEGGKGLAGIEAFDAFRKDVVTPLAFLDKELLLSNIDLFQQTYAGGYALHNALMAIDRSRSKTDRVAALCTATRTLVHAMEALPEWIVGGPQGSLERCLASPATSSIGRLACEARTSISRWNTGCGGAEGAELAFAVAESPYAIIVVDTLIRRTMPSGASAESFATVHYMNHFRAGEDLYPNAEMSERNFDIAARIVLIPLIHRAVGEQLPSEQTHRMLRDHYLAVAQFAIARLGASTDQTKAYRPCISAETSAQVSNEAPISARDVCERIEFVTLPASLNGVLFAIAENWIQGERIERTQLNASEWFLARAEMRLEMLRHRFADAPADITADIYHGLLDTVSLTQLMLAVEFDGKPTKSQCRTIMAGLEEAGRYLRTTSTPLRDADYGAIHLARSNTHASVARRLRIAENYCQET